MTKHNVAFEIFSRKEKKAVIICSEICMRLLFSWDELTALNYYFIFCLESASNPSLPFGPSIYLHAWFFFLKYCTMHCRFWMSSSFGFCSLWSLTISLNSGPSSMVCHIPAHSSVSSQLFTEMLIALLRKGPCRSTYEDKHQIPEVCSIKLCFQPVGCILFIPMSINLLLWVSCDAT